MNCPLCGEICCCHSEPPPAAVPQCGSNAPGELQGEHQSPEPAQPLAEMDASIALDGTAIKSPDAEDDVAWRDELSARLNRYRSRRKMRPPRYPSLRLQFDRVEPASGSDAPQSAPSFDSFEPVSEHALALNEMLQEHSSPQCADPSSSPAAEAAPSTVSVGHSAKIIEFPRFAWGPPPSPPDQLAEPVSDRPRILEAPEIAPPPPALGGITMEAAQRPETEKRAGIDMPLQSASLARRVLAGAIDGSIVAAASALFGFIFWKVAAVRPPLAQMVGLAAGIPCLFWVVYQYLLLVYAASTPGLCAAGLTLARFDGTGTNRSLRRWRVLASYLSAASLGMGYAWVFLDEDVLCWHDRITHTYLAPRKP